MLLPLLAFSLLALAPSPSRDAPLTGEKTIACSIGPRPLPSPDELPFEHPNMTADVRRMAYLNYTLLVIEDNLTLVATNYTEISSFLYGFPIDWVERNRVFIMYKEARNASGAPLSFSEEIRLGDMGFLGFLLSLPSPLKLGENETVQLSIRFVVNGSLSSTGFSREKESFTYRLEIPLYPTTSLELRNFTFRASLPLMATISSLTPDYMKSEEKADIWYVYCNRTGPIARFTTETSAVEFDRGDPLPLFSCRELTRELSLGPFGELRISDTYELRSKTNHEVNYFDVVLPPWASSISVSDLMGPLKKTVMEIGGVKKVRITLRTPVKLFDPLTLIVSYDAPWEDHVSKKGFSSFSLEFVMEEALLWPVERLFVKVILPEGASISSASPEPDHVLRGAFREEVGFLLGLSTPFDEDKLSVSFSFSVFWPSFWPMCWASLGAVVACVVIKLITVAPIPAPILLVPAEKIIEFVEAYERRSSLKEELISLREALDKRKISRKRYKARRRAIREELEKLDKKIASLVPELRKAGGFLAEIVGSLEAAESELESVERDMRALEARYLRKEIGSEAYRRLLRDYRRREDRARTAIREALLRLRELVA